ncbi:MAG TPA: GNAT family N-acetyltransferase [Thermoanaerobaculia bacterium]|nr:GNAT family N-acetyltransferase [Thermoanaerobaculia bacterium]
MGALFTRCFHVSRAGEEWRWRYRDHPHGGPWSSIAVAGDGEIVAHYGAYPVRLERREGERFRTLVAAQVGDLMSAPDLRGTGRGGTSLFARTGDHFYAARRRDGVAFSYGVHTGTSRAFSVRFAGAVPFLPAPLWVYEPSAHGPALARRTRALRLAGWRARRVAAPDARFDAFHERARHGYRLLARRDRRYLAWRYFSRPGRRYELHLAERGEELLGWAIFHREDGRLVWGDALVAPEAAAAAPLLLASALRTGESVTTVEGWFSPAAGWWQRALAETGFREAPDPQGLVFTAVAGCEPVPAARLGADFYLTRGDSDLF